MSWLQQEGDGLLPGQRGGMIFQNPMTCLNPVYTVGNQLIEALRAHDKKISKADAAKRAMEMLELVGINNVAKRMKQYPHEFSGGMRQRVMIAMGLICHPKLLIADEPTTALDVTIQAQILELMKELQKKTHMALSLSPTTWAWWLRSATRSPSCMPARSWSRAGRRHLLQARPPLHRGPAALHAPRGRREL